MVDILFLLESFDMGHGWQCIFTDVLTWGIIDSFFEEDI